MAYVSNMRLLECVRILEGYSGGAIAKHYAYSKEERLAALRDLQTAPPDKAWNQGLLMALGDEEIYKEAINGCMARLKGFEKKNQAAQDAFLKALLDFGFQIRAESTLKARCEIIRQIAKFLYDHPLQYEHHRSFLLSKARTIQTPNYHRDLASAVQEAVTLLRQESPTRSDTLVIRQLSFERRLDAYQRLTTSRTRLLVYLTQDSQIEIAALNREWFEAYRALLTTQAQDHDIVLMALSNLYEWLRQLQHYLTQDTQRLHEIERASKGEPWNSLHWPIRLHLEAHATLFPGPTIKGDLLTMLCTTWNTAEHEKILTIGLEIISHFPALRARIKRELYEYLRQKQANEKEIVRNRALQRIKHLMIAYPADLTAEYADYFTLALKYERKRRVG